MKLFKIAIDGPAASGKSTIAKKIAEKLGILYIDSGAMFRAVTLYALRSIDPDLKEQDYSQDLSEDFVNSILNGINIKFEDNSKKVLVNGVDVSKEIRLNLVSKYVSQVASYKQVRERLLKLQQEISKSSSVVMDGRDIGTVVFPDAELKIFMIASVEVRAERRYKELQARGEKIELEKLIEEITKRDELDSSRSQAPLVKAKDAIEIDTDGMTVDEVLERVLGTIELLTTINSRH